MNIVVAGAGPAGLAAACHAAESGAAVTLIDDNPLPGGQIWRNAPGHWSRRLETAGVRFWSGARIVSAERSQLLVETPESVATFPYEKIIVATGSRELFLPFPGWTLPGVFGAGGLQALVKSGFPVAGKRIVVAGAGPLLLAVAANLKKRGARVLCVAEQASWVLLAAFGVRLPLRKLREALSLWSPAYSPGTWVAEALGANHLEAVRLQFGARSRTLSCDYLGIGYGLTPNNELLQTLGCAEDTLNPFQQTENPRVYAAGEVTGIGGVDLALAEGAIAGLAAAGQMDQAREHFATRDRWARFARRLATAFALRPELKALAQPDTIVCRCEDVPLRRLLDFQNWREAKLQTRCGMGPCQGRVCGPITAHLLGWSPGSVRAPLFPARVGSFLEWAGDNTEQ